jgi:anti-sigma regulatory factor (Ser/Thr protein kinase)
MLLPEETWLYVRSDGTLEAVETVPESADPLPGLWVGRPLLQSSELPEPLVEALQELLARPLGGGHSPRGPAVSRDAPPVQRRTVTLGAGRVHAIRIDGIPLRRAYTPLVETILRALDPLIVQATQARVALVVERSEFTATTAHLDGEKIAWALVTLVGNALRHTTAGGTIHVRLRSAGSEHLELTVEDNGAGIPEARLRHLFEHDPATGRRAGLALVLVRDIVVAHGGTVAVSRGKHGKGSLFSLQIPLR